MLAWMSIVTVAFVVLAPLAALLLASASPGSLLEVPPQGLSFRWYHELFIGDATWRHSALVSFVVCGGAAVLGLALSTLLVLAKEARRWTADVSYILLLSLIAIPAPALALALYVLLRALASLPSSMALLLSYTVAALPIILGSVHAGLSKAEARLVEAAATLGASPRQQLQLRFCLARPVILAGLALAVLFVLDDVLIAMFVADSDARPLSLLLWDGIRQSLSPVIAAASVVLLTLAAALGYFFVTPAFREDAK